MTRADVSVVIPSIGTTAYILGEHRLMVVHLLDGLLNGTDATPPFEVVLVIDPNMPTHVHDVIREVVAHRPQVRLVYPPKSYPGKFDFSHRANFGAALARHDVLVFLNDDMSVLEPNWLAHLLEPLHDPGVALVGGLLSYPDGSVQHAGMLATSQHVRHVDETRDFDPAGWARHMSAVQPVAAVTGAMLAVRRDAFEAVGGFSSEFPLSLNDADLCFKIRRSGGSVVFTPFARMQHYETKSRPPVTTPEEVAHFRGRWSDFLLLEPSSLP